MNVGLPGTGIGSVFYFFLVLFMPLQELYLAARGRSSLERWKTVGVQWAIFSTILLVLWGEGALITAAITWLKTTDTWIGYFLLRFASGNQSFRGFGSLAAAASFMVLGSVCAFTFLLNMASKAGLIQPSKAVPAHVVE
jgi:hypothetical protein